MRIHVAAALAALFLSAPVALAQQASSTTQTAPTTSTAALPAAEVDKVAVPVWPNAAITWPEQQQAAEASFSLGEIEGVSPSLLSGVTAKGYARKVAVDNQNVGQVLVISVAKGDREEVISSEGLSAQFDVGDASQLFPEKIVEVSGSKSALVAALERLAIPVSKEEKPVAKDDVSQNPTTAGGGSSNDLAAGYQTPEVSATQPAETKDPVTEYRTTTDGCQIRIDTAQGVAVQQNKIQTFTDGTLSADGTCADSGVTYALKRSYASCPTDVVNLPSLTASPQYSLYYLDEAGENHPVGECVKDDTTYDIVEDESRCSIDLNYTTGKATPQAALVYVGRNNAKIEVRGCAASTKTAALTLTESKTACPVRTDATGKVRYEQSQWTYIRDGVVQQATSCADTGRTFVTTSAGCPVRIDAIQAKVVLQSKDQTFDKGSLVSETACADTAASYALKTSYASCPVDVVDLDAKKAWPQYSLYYIDALGETHSVASCAKDQDTTYVITEDETQCSVSLDFSAATATPQAALIYTNRNNATVQARGCQDSTKSAAITMTESSANCTIRHDFPANVSYELSMWTYLRAGVTYQAAPCSDTGRTFPHQKIYTDAGGNYVCTPITDLSHKAVTLQYRRRITVDGVEQFISECTPDTASSAILATTTGCTDPSTWTHDLAASISYGQERFYYLKGDGSRQYVTACQASSIAYPHDVTIIGYQYHDDQLWAYALTTVTISVGGSPYTIVSSEVLPGAPQMAYVLDGTVDQATGTSTYDGCDAYRETARYEQWQRPDDSLYLKRIGTGTPTGPVDVCINTVVKTGAARLTNYCGQLNSASTIDPLVWGYYDHYLSKTERKNIETGAVIVTSCIESTETKVPVGNNGVWGEGNGTGGDRWPNFCNDAVVPAAYRGAECVNGLCRFWAPGYAKAKQQWHGYATELGTTCPAGF